MIGAANVRLAPQLLLSPDDAFLVEFEAFYELKVLPRAVILPDLLLLRDLKAVLGVGDGQLYLEHPLPRLRLLAQRRGRLPPPPLHPHLLHLSALLLLEHVSPFHDVTLALLLFCEIDNGLEFFQLFLFHQRTPLRRRLALPLILEPLALALFEHCLCLAPQR